VGTADDDPREVKRARSSTVLAARKQAEAERKEGKRWGRCGGQ